MTGLQIEHVVGFIIGVVLYFAFKTIIVGAYKQYKRKKLANLKGYKLAIHNGPVMEIDKVLSPDTLQCTDHFPEGCGVLVDNETYAIGPRDDDGQ